MNENTSLQNPAEPEEQTLPAGTGKISAAATVIVIVVMLFACLCGVLLGMFSPALSKTLHGARLSSQKRYTEAANVYKEVPTLMEELQQKLPDTLNLDTLLGVKYNLLRSYGHISSLQAGSMMLEDFSKGQIAQFPLSKLKAYTDQSAEYTLLTDDFRQTMSQFINAEETAYENVNKDIVFAAIDAYITAHHAPAWAVAILRSYVGSLAGDDAQTRLAYFDGVKDSDDGISEYSPYIMPIFRELGHTQEILAFCERKFALNRNDSDALLGKGKIQLADGNLKGAQKTVKLAKKYVGKSGIPEALQLEVLRRAKKYDDAVKLYTDYRAAQEAMQSTAFYEATRQYAIVLLLQGDYQGAEDMAFEAATGIPETGSEYEEHAYFLVGLTAGLAEDTEMIEYYSLEQNAVGTYILSAEDKKTALEKVFLEDRGDIV